MSNKIIILDIDSLSSEIIKGIEQGTYKIFNGVVRDINGQNIIKHIPTKVLDISEKDIENIPELLQKVSSSNIALTAVSTSVILGAIVVATKIIVNKLNQIQSSIDDIKKELQEQNLFQYFLELKNYIAISESLRELLKNPKCIEENKDILILKLHEMSVKRNGLLLTISERLNHIDNVSIEHKKVIFKFINQSISLLPKIAYIEQEGAYALNRFYLGQSIENEFNNKYNKLDFQYKRFLNKEIKSSILGSNPLSSNDIESLKQDYANEFKVNQLLIGNS